MWKSFLAKFCPQILSLMDLVIATYIRLSAKDSRYSDGKIRSLIDCETRLASWFTSSKKTKLSCPRHKLAALSYIHPSLHKLNCDREAFPTDLSVWTEWSMIPSSSIFQRNSLFCYQISIMATALVHFVADRGHSRQTKRNKHVYRAWYLIIGKWILLHFDSRGNISNVFCWFDCFFFWLIINDRNNEPRRINFFDPRATYFQKNSIIRLLVFRAGEIIFWELDTLEKRLLKSRNDMAVTIVSWFYGNNRKRVYPVSEIWYRWRSFEACAIRFEIDLKKYSCDIEISRRTRKKFTRLRDIISNLFFNAFFPFLDSRECHKNEICTYLQKYGYSWCIARVSTSIFEKLFVFHIYVLFRTMLVEIDYASETVFLWLFHFPMRAHSINLMVCYSSQPPQSLNTWIHDAWSIPRRNWLARLSRAFRSDIKHHGKENSV